jgi:indolepyruvate ferredoxin oxidoreductase
MNVGEISERFLGNKIYANSILLGVAYQRGTLPLELENILWAFERNLRPADLEVNLKAFHIGRKIVQDPTSFESPGDDGAVGYADLVEDKAGILERFRGAKVSKAYRELASQVRSADLDEATRIQFALGAYDLVQWGGVDVAHSYAERVQAVYDRDSARYGYAATGAVVRQLARVMAYKDEIYVAHLLTSEEKRRRDCERYRIDPGRGDRISYRHLTRPHMRVLGVDVRFDVKTRPWMLRLLRRTRFLRTLFPGWHREEKDYRDWYVGLVDGFEYADGERYRAYVRALELPEEVRGYREVIWPKMAAAQRTAEQILSGGVERSGTGVVTAAGPVVERA